MSKTNTGTMAEWFRALDFSAAIPLWPLAGVVLGNPWFNSSAPVLVNGQLVCLQLVGILTMICLSQLFVSYICSASPDFML